MSQTTLSLPTHEQWNQLADLFSQMGTLMREIKHPQIIPPDQTYFWTDSWIKWMREAETDLQTGQIKRFGSMEALVDDLGL